MSTPLAAPLQQLKPGDLDERYGSLDRLADHAERADEDGLVARLRTCAAAQALVGVSYSDPTREWTDALQELRTELAAARADATRSARSALEHTDVDGAWQRATAEFYERLNHALRTWDAWWDDLCNPADEENDMATATPTKPRRRRSKKPPAPGVWRDPSGELRWRCPQCRTEHHESVRACGCEYVRPPLKKLQAVADGPGVPQSQRDAAAKETAVDAAGPQAPELVRVADVPMAEVVDNPLNTRRNFGDVQSIADSMRAVGQLQECVGREKGRKVELVAGSRRFRAAKLAGLKTLRVRVVACDQAMALEIMGRENADRETWDAISKAAWYQALLDERKCSTRELAVHLGVSQADVANHVRMLKLPDDWQQRVISQEITPTQARHLATWADRPVVLKVLAKRLKQEPIDGTQEFACDLCAIVEGLTRPCDPGDRYSFHANGGWQVGKVLFTEALLTEHGEALDIVTITSPYEHTRGDTERRAFNVKRWDALHGNLRKAAEKKAAARAQRSGNKAAKAAKPLSASQRKQRAAEQRQQLEQKVGKYKVCWLQARVTARVAKIEGYLPIKLLLFYAAGDDQRRARATDLAAVVKAAGGKAKTRSYAGVDVWSTLASLKTDESIRDVARQCLTVWLVHDPFEYRSDLQPRDVVAIAAELKIDVVRDWRVDQKFLELFTKDQLAGLAREWKLTKQIAAAGEKRKDRIDAVLKADAARRLPAPKILNGVKV